MDEANDAPESQSIDPALQIASLENQLEVLDAEVQRLRRMLPKKHTVDWFILRVTSKLGRVYGWKTAYVLASREAGLRAVTMDILDEWLRAKHVPMWACQQVDRMKLGKPLRRKTRGFKWNSASKEVLIKAMQEDPMKPDAELATLCSRELGHTFTVGSIKGAIYRLRHDEGERV